MRPRPGGAKRDSGDIMTITGTPGDDTLTGTSGDDTFDLRQGGNDTAQGLAGKDLFIMGATFTATDAIDGGDGTADIIRLKGDYSSGLALGATTLVNVETMQIDDGFSYNITTNEATVAAGSTLRVDASQLLGSNGLTFNGAAESDGHFHFIGGAGDDTLTGGAQHDVFDLNNHGNDTATGGGGNDTFKMGNSLTAADTLNGGDGSDTVTLNGNYISGSKLTLGDGTFTSVENLVLSGAHSYNITTAEGTVVGDTPLTVDASALGAGDSLTFNGSATSRINIIGGAGNDVIVAGHGVQNIVSTADLSQGGNDTFTGGIGNDVIQMGAALTAADAISGGNAANNDFNEVVLNGDYSTTLTLGPATLTDIGELVFTDGHSYSLIENNANVASGSQMVIEAGALTAGHNATFDGSAETDGSFDFDGGGGTNTFTSGAGTDTFSGGTGTDIFNAGGSKDTFSFSTANFAVTDQLNGGAGADTLTLIGPGGNWTFNATTITNVESIGFVHTGGSVNNFDITLNDGNVAAGQTLSINATETGTLGDTMTIDGSAETNGHFAFTNGFASVAFIGGALSDSFNLAHAQRATVTGGGGADMFKAATFTHNEFTSGLHDTFAYNAVSESTSTGYDTITNSQADGDYFSTSNIGFTTGVDTAVTTGALSTATFDSDLATAVGAGQMAAHHAVLFTANAGTLSGHTFLVIDENGTAGYQASADLVIDVTGFSGTLTADNFL
jgi:hypothetical protein